MNTLSVSYRGVDISRLKGNLQHSLNYKHINAKCFPASAGQSCEVMLHRGFLALNCGWNVVQKEHHA